MNYSERGAAKRNTALSFTVSCVCVLVAIRNCEFESLVTELNLESEKLRPRPPIWGAELATPVAGLFFLEDGWRIPAGAARGAPTGAGDGPLPSTLTCSLMPAKQWSRLPQTKNRSPGLARAMVVFPFVNVRIGSVVLQLWKLSFATS
ncbi:hypothetical protein DY000_02000322 [Brassica cretica]|uniref:Uncharacterized protein n=1 Tax=Brassica cretica TaxID=69181 RepID=A0ABQ7CCK8_BRACR|nr:hypothetical protein DY000_02000322 [Brassica cretica]